MTTVKVTLRIEIFAFGGPKKNVMGKKGSVTVTLWPLFGCCDAFGILPLISISHIYCIFPARRHEATEGTGRGQGRAAKEVAPEFRRAPAGHRGFGHGQGRRLHQELLNRKEEFHHNHKAVVS